MEWAKEILKSKNYEIVFYILTNLLLKKSLTLTLRHTLDLAIRRKKL